MSEHAGEKTEQPTHRRLEEAIKQGQFPRSAEVQTVFVLFAAMLALLFTGRDTWNQFLIAFNGILGHLNEFTLDSNTIPTYAISAFLFLGHCVVPVLVATAIGGLLAGGLQSRFRTASEALDANWERVNPLEGFRRVFSARTIGPAAVSFLKLTVVLALSYNLIQSILSDPIFFSSIDVARIADFLTSSSFKIMGRVSLALLIIAACDYGYQIWRTQKDLMMTKEEVKEEMKTQEGNAQVKSQQRRRRNAVTQRKMLLDVPKADVVVTNPTHLAVALCYDRKNMRAPKVVAKGSRLNALRIREIAKQNQVPVLENKPLARLLFKYGKVGGEIPAQLYAAVAEVLAWVYRINAYRYYRERTAGRDSAK